MIVLRILGPLRLEGLDRRGELAVLTGEKRLAVLVFLILAGRGEYIRRDTLLALFWPEADQTHARGALRALVHQLRAALGPAALLSRSDQELGVDLAQIGCDALEFERACLAGDWEEAVGLYRGPLLEGFGLLGAAGFEDWLGGERARVQGLARDLAWQVAGRARQANDAAGEIAALRRLLVWAPYEEGPARHLMSALDRTGNRAGALQAFEQFAARLRTDLDVAPAPETVALAATLRARADPAPERIPEQAAWRSSSAAVPAKGAAQARGATRLPRTVIGMVVIAIALTLGWLEHARPTTDPHLIAVLPFDVTGPDTILERLSQAMPVLLGGRLNAEAGPRPMDLGAVLRATTRRPTGATGMTRYDGVGSARAAGAGRVLIGVVGSTPSGVLVNTTLLDAVTGEARARASVEGRVDSLDHLLDRLAALLLARAAREPEQRLPHLTRVPLPALVWYLEGQTLLRAGQADQARDAFARAIEGDSTFATAALAASIAAGAGGGPWVRRGLEMAWRWRDRLMHSDWEVVNAKLGPRYPESSSLAERLAAWEGLVPPSGGQPYLYEILYGYGDQLLHFGPLLGIANAHQQAAVALERAYQLDSTLPAALQHLADLAFIHRDTARLRQVIARLLRRGDADTAQWVARWMLAAAEGDAPGRSRVARDLDQAPLYNLSQQAGIAVADAERVATLWRRQATTLEAVTGQLRLLWLLSLNRGRPLHARMLFDSAVTLAGSAPHLAGFTEEMERAAILAVLYWDADTAAAQKVLPRVAARALGPPPQDSLARSDWLRDRCVLEEWQLWHRTVSTDIRTIGAFAAAEPAAGLCVIVLEALAATLHGSPDASYRLDRLDALARIGPPGWLEWFPHGNLLIARLFERQGRLAEAYAASRRRGIYYLRFNQYLSSQVREEGGLALAVGDTAGAIGAWRHFMGLRDAPEPALLPERERIRGWLTALTAPAH